jgi:hypothetical protein
MSFDGSSGAERSLAAVTPAPSTTLSDTLLTKLNSGELRLNGTASFLELRP